MRDFWAFYCSHHLFFVNLQPKWMHLTSIKLI